MTPAPISVERLEPASSYDSTMRSVPYMAANEQGGYVRHSDYAALLHQLAEREADVDFVRDCLRSRGEYIEGQPPLPLAVVAYDHMWKRAEAAESKLAERDAEVERLRRECDLRKHAVDRWMPCPDHRDKVDGRCQVCAKETAERAREKAFGLLREVASDYGARHFLGDDLDDRIAAFLAENK